MPPITKKDYDNTARRINALLSTTDVQVIDFSKQSNYTYAIYLGSEAYDMYYGNGFRGRSTAVEEMLQRDGFYLDPFYSSTLILERI